MIKYEIIGLGNGLREIDIPQEAKSVSVTSMSINERKVKNNTTGEWENLNSYIEKNIQDVKK